MKRRILAQKRCIFGQKFNIICSKTKLVGVLAKGIIDTQFQNCEED